jgi:hypothetical protein
MRNGSAAAIAAVVAVAAICAFVAIHALRGDHRCKDALAAVRAGDDAAAAAVAEHCGDPRDVAVAAAVLGGRGQRAAAAGLARHMTTASPDDYLGWLALGRLAGDDRALARAHELNPRGVPPPGRPR